MTKKASKWDKFMQASARRSGIAFGIAVMAIGFNMLPIKPPPALAESVGLFIMFIGGWVVVASTSAKQG